MSGTGTALPGPSAGLVRPTCEREQVAPRKGPVLAHGQREGGGREAAGGSGCRCQAQLRVRPGELRPQVAPEAERRPGVLHIGSRHVCAGSGHGTALAPAGLRAGPQGNSVLAEKITLKVPLFRCPKLPLMAVEKAKVGVLFCSIFSLNSRRQIDVAVNAATHFATEAFLCG